MLSDHFLHCFRSLCLTVLAAAKMGIKCQCLINEPVRETSWPLSGPWALNGTSSPLCRPIIYLSQNFAQNSKSSISYTAPPPPPQSSDSFHMGTTRLQEGIWPKIQPKEEHVIPSSKYESETKYASVNNNQVWCVSEVLSEDMTACGSCV